MVLGLIDDLKAEPQIPGSYITGRTIRNAFVTTVSDNVDPIDTLYITLDAINTGNYQQETRIWPEYGTGIERGQKHGKK